MKIQVGKALHLSIDDTTRRPCHDQLLDYERDTDAVMTSRGGKYRFDTHAAKAAAGRFVAMTADPFCKYDHAEKEALAPKDLFTQPIPEWIFFCVPSLLDVRAVGAGRIFSADRSIPIRVKLIAGDPTDTSALASVTGKAAVLPGFSEGLRRGQAWFSGFSISRLAYDDSELNG